MLLQLPTKAVLMCTCNYVLEQQITQILVLASEQPEEQGQDLC